jgi:hypothetical protein
MVILFVLSVSHLSDNWLKFFGGFFGFSFFEKKSEQPQLPTAEW